jgi:hypothetical protein
VIPWKLCYHIPVDVWSVPMYRPFYHIRSNELYTESSSPGHHEPDCENPHQFQQSVREFIELNHLSTAQMHSSLFQNTTWLFGEHRLFSLSGQGRLRFGTFGFSAPVRRGGCGGLLVRTDCVRWWRWCAGGTLSFKNTSEVTVESGVNFEDYVRFLSCHLFGPVYHGQTWKGWERSGEKAWLSWSIMIIKLKLAWLSRSMSRILPLGTSPWLSLSVILAKTRLKVLILIILSNYQAW